MKETGSGVSSFSQEGLIENQLTGLDTKAALELGRNSEYGSESECGLGPVAEPCGVGSGLLCLPPSDPPPVYLVSQLCTPVLPVALASSSALVLSLSCVCSSLTP